MALATIPMLLAFVCFVLASFPRIALFDINLVALGLALFAASLLVAGGGLIS